jgi:hypothetical protein
MPMIRRRRPLLRAAAVGGAGYMAGKRAAESRAPMEEAPPAPPSRAPGAGMSPEATEQLKAIAELHDRGVLTDAEFEQQKKALLGGV